MIEKEMLIKSLGYNIIVIWESDRVKLIKESKYD